MSQICQRIEETLVCGEALTNAQSLHIAGCNVCKATQRTSASLTSTLKRMPEPCAPLGFATRLEATVHSQVHRNAVWRPRYFALAVGGALASAAALILLLRSTGQTNRQDPAELSGAVVHTTSEDLPGLLGNAATTGDAATTGNATDDADWAQLLVLADVDLSLQTSAQWHQFLEPISATEVFELESKE